MAIPDFTSVGDAVAFNNAKSFGDAGANLALQGAQAHNSNNDALATMRLSVSGLWANLMASPDPLEAAATRTILSGRESMGISEALALAQVAAKTAQTTPPVTP